MQYYFNGDLLGRLYQVVNMPRTAFAKMLGMTYYNLYRYMQKKDISLLLLNEICNKIHLPISYFFTTEQGAQPLPIASDNYKPSTIDAQYLHSLFRGAKKSSIGLSLRQTNAAIGVAEPVIPTVVMDPKNITIKASQLVDWANALMINLGDVIDCPSRKIPDIYDKMNMETRLTLIKARKEVEGMRRAQNAMVEELEALREENKKLKEFESIGIAATPRVGYERKKQ